MKFWENVSKILGGEASDRVRLGCPSASPEDRSAPLVASGSVKRARSLIRQYLKCVPWSIFTREFGDFDVKSLLVVLCLVSTPSSAHWLYSKECCDENDCRPLANSEVSILPKGYHTRSNDQTLPYQDFRLRKSPDGSFHGCFIGGDPKRLLRCLYVPEQGS
jgi:hypothetical protein